jgi:hypothetical protein
MISISSLKTIGTRGLGRTVLVAKKFSPEVLTIAGVVGVVAAAVMASRATLKLEPVIDNIKYGLESIEELEEDASYPYAKKTRQRDMGFVYAHGGLAIVKLYGPSITLGACSIACIVGANGIMRKRNVALAAAYKGLESTFSEYRKRVAEEIGDDKELDIRRGFREEEVTDEKGKKHKVVTVNPNGKSQYARFFDELNKNWEKTAEYNLLFVRCQQNYANDILHARGHLFLNEVYDMLGIAHSQAGAVVGWIIGKGDEFGDTFVDFGIYNLQSERAREFVNGYEKAILLDFNVAGVIYDKI